MPDEAVIDASVAFKLILPEDHTATAAMLMFTLARDGVERIAPPFFPFEVTNGLYQRVLEGTLTPATAASRLHALAPFEIQLRTTDDLHDRALVLAYQLGRGSSYDSHYLALALARDCEFWTADGPFFRAAQPNFPDNIRWLGDFNPDA